VLPTGRNFGRKTQKGPDKNLNGGTKQLPNFWPIFQKPAEKWPNVSVELAEILCQKLATLFTISGSSSCRNQTGGSVLPRSEFTTDRRP
jgi:hypothetical protein